MHGLIMRAQAFARSAHVGQKRKHGSQEDFINHPRRVADRVSKLAYATPELVAAAWLHDVVEDTPITIEEIQKEFGTEIRAVVFYLTDLYTKEHCPDKNRKERKNLEIEKYMNAPKVVKVIKMCDRMDNMKDIGGADEGFKKVYLKESRALFAALKGADGALDNEFAAILTEFAMAVEPEEC